MSFDEHVPIGEEEWAKMVAQMAQPNAIYNTYTTTAAQPLADILAAVEEMKKHVVPIDPFPWCFYQDGLRVAAATGCRPNELGKMVYHLVVGTEAAAKRMLKAAEDGGIAIEVEVNLTRLVLVGIKPLEMYGNPFPLTMYQEFHANHMQPRRPVEGLPEREPSGGRQVQQPADPGLLQDGHRWQ